MSFDITRLVPLLEAAGSAGCAMNISCESTARDAMMLNYKVLFVSDATATHTDFEHNITLNNMMLTFADVVSTADVTSLLKA
ncbi:MAG: isochorismatase family protein [Rhodospirillales bacterium]|nr:isochorismatase family protein [Rhodospirillales bacterium]